MEYMLIGRHVIALTDNVTLLYNVRKPKQISDSHTLRKLTKISEIVDQIYYIQFEQNVVADYLKLNKLCASLRALRFF